MTKSEIKNYKYLQDFLKNQLGKLDTNFSYKLNTFLFIMNCFILITHFLRIFALSQTNSIGFFESFSHEDAVPLFSWCITIFAVLVTGGSTFFNRKYLFNNFTKIKIFFKRLFSIKSNYNYFMANKEIIFPLFQHHINREIVLVELLERLKENKPIPTSTAQFMLVAINEKLNNIPKDSQSYDNHVNQVNNFFKPQQDIQFFSEQEKPQQDIHFFSEQEKNQQDK